MALLKNIVRQGLREGIGDGISKGISKGIGQAVGNAVNKAVTPAAERYANRTAERINEATDSMSRDMSNYDERPMQQPGQQAQQRNAQPTGSGFSSLGNAFANLERAAQGYVTEVGKNMKVCESCGAGATADQKFCPACGARLPEQTLSQGAVCPACGRQNAIGTKFCSACGTKLPSAIAEETARARNDGNVLARWNAMLPQYPCWNCGGTQYALEDQGGAVTFQATFPSRVAADAAVRQYQQLAMQYGFHPAGQYPSNTRLFNMIGGVCYCIDMDHLYDGSTASPELYFYIDEPTGGYNYTPPRPTQNTRRRFFG